MKTQADEKFSLSAQENNFIDYQSPGFYVFVNQTGPIKALDDNDRSHLERQDLQPEMFLAMSRALTSVLKSLKKA